MSIGLTSRSSTSPTRSSAAAKKTTRASSAPRKTPITVCRTSWRSRSWTTRSSPAQFAPDRIQRADVQQLLCRVSVRPSQAFSQRFPDEMAARITVTLHDGRALDREVTEYPGLNAPAMSWKHVARKFDQLSRDRLTPDQGRGIADAVRTLDAIRVSDLTRLLASVGRAGTWPGCGSSTQPKESPCQAHLTARSSHEASRSSG